MTRKERPYDPGWLVEFARQAASEYPWLPAALEKCTSGVWTDRAYIRFVPTGDWGVVENIVLDDTPEGDIVLDVLEGQRIGGIEYLSRL